MTEKQDIMDRLTALEEGFLADAPATWNEIDRRLTALETATGALADAMKERAKIKPDVFVQTIKGFIKNLDGHQEEYLMGMKNAYRYALAVYEGTV